MQNRPNHNQTEILKVSDGSSALIVSVITEHSKKIFDNVFTNSTFHENGEEFNRIPVISKLLDFDFHKYRYFSKSIFENNDIL